MIERPVALIVHQAGTCPLMKHGDRMVVAGCEVLKSSETRLCANAVCSVYPKLRDLLNILPANAGLPDDFLLCDSAGCDAAFRMEFADRNSTVILTPPEDAVPSVPVKPATNLPATAIQAAAMADIPVPGARAVAQAEIPIQSAAASGRLAVVPPVLADNPPAQAVSSVPAPKKVTDTQMIPLSQHTRRLERTAMTATQVLKNAGPFLARLPKEIAAELITACRTQRYEHGEVILKQGVVGEKLYIMSEGFVEVVKRSDNNDETVLVTLGRGDCFGEMSILTGEVTSAEVRAKSSAAVLSLHKDELEGMLMRRPVLSREFSKLLAERLKASNQSLQSELSRGILGKLSMISLVDLVQTLNQSRRTGTLVLSFAGEEARLGFRNGAMCTAVCDSVQGEEAFYKVVCWPDGDFCFEQTEPGADDPGKVKTDIMGLMMEGMRRMDEARMNARKSGANAAVAK